VGYTCDHCGLTSLQIGSISDHLFKSEAEYQAEQRARLARGEATTDDIVEAVMLERERCAKIAEDDYYNDEGGGLIAAKIRSGE
jgi:hypothetical protein